MNHGASQSVYKREPTDHEPTGQFSRKTTLQDVPVTLSGPGTLPGSQIVPTGFLGRSRRGIFRGQTPTFQHGTSGRASSQVIVGDILPVRPTGWQRRFPKGGAGVPARKGRP
jgi:hypothetical protein